MLKTPWLVLVLCLLLTVPCLARGSFVYVSNYGDGTISQFRANPNGTLTPLSPPTVKAHILCHSLAVARGQFLYATSARDWHKHDCVVSQYKIAPDGRLTPLSPAQVLVPGTPATVAVAPSGHFAYVFNRQGTVAQFRIRVDGRLTPLSPAVVGVAKAGGVTPIVGFDKLRHVLYGSYVVGFGETVIGGTFAVRIGSDGQLQPLPNSATFYSGFEGTAGPPYSISLTPNGRYAYVTESLRDNLAANQWREVVAQSRTRPNGIPAPLRPANVPVEVAGRSFTDATGRFLYLVYQKTDMVNATAAYRLAHAPIHRNGTSGSICVSKPRHSRFVAPDTGVLANLRSQRALLLLRRRELPVSSTPLSPLMARCRPLRPSRTYAGYGPLRHRLRATSQDKKKDRDKPRPWGVPAPPELGVRGRTRPAWRPA